MEEKTYIKSPRVSFWPLKINRRATPLARRIPLREAIRVAIAWDMPCSFEELREKAFSSPMIMERLFTRSQTVDWIIEVIGIEGLVKSYPSFRSAARSDLRDEIEAFYFYGRRSD